MKHANQKPALALNDGNLYGSLQAETKTEHGITVQLGKYNGYVPGSKRQKWVLAFKL